ncbi:MAG: hypothetical protein WC852_04630 [Candidatus Nanoarchaeia archaeon]|jgi:hypothetical protein
MAGENKLKEYLALHCSQLEYLLEKDNSEYEDAPKESPSKKVDSIEEAQDIFKKAKISIDELLKLEPYAYNPSVEFKKYGRDRIITSSYVSNSLLLVGGVVLAASMPGCIMIGGFMSGVGFLRLANLMHISSKGTNPEFSKEQNKIYISRKRKDILLQDMTQAYALAIAENNFNETSMKYGFAAGASSRVLKHGECRRDELKQSAVLLEYAIKSIRRDSNENRHIKSLKDKLNKAGLIHTAQKEAIAFGYSAFRLAEEKSGRTIYKAVLEGNTAILFQ